MPPSKKTTKKKKEEETNETENKYSSDSEDKETISGFKISKNKKEYVIEILVPSLITTVLSYMEQKPEFFNTHVSKKLLIVNNQFETFYTEPIFFNDTDFKVKGRMEWHKIESPEKNDEIKLNLKIFIDEIDNDKCYVSYINNYINNIAKNGHYVSLYYYKILHNSIVTYKYYHQTVEQWKKDVDIVINEFFSIHKKYIFSIFNKKKQAGNEATSWNNFIFHGKPGTGKSSTIYRIALYLKMNIISLDISLYLNKKKELYSLFYGRNFTLPDGTPQEAIKDTIIVLEEFDYTIDKQIDVENFYMVMEILKREFVVNKKEELKINHRKLLDLKEKQSMPPPHVSNTKNFENLNSSGYTAPYDPAQIQNQQFMQARDNFLGNNGNFNNSISAREDIIDKLNIDNSISMIENELNKIVRDAENHSKSNILRISDLLELFQGPVPVPNRFIIATTNNYERIKMSLPSLFRSSRLTSINFDYLNWDDFQDLCKYYFGKHTNIEKRPIDVATSYIIELAIKHSGHTVSNHGQSFVGGLDSFIKELFVLKK